MKSVRVVAFKKKKKALREVNNDKSESFEMEIIDKGELYKALEGPEKN